MGGNLSSDLSSEPAHLNVVKSTNLLPSRALVREIIASHHELFGSKHTLLEELALFESADEGGDSFDIPIVDGVLEGVH